MRGKNACFWLGPDRGLHQGQRPQRPHPKAAYMAAPDPFVEMSDFPLAPRAPSIHGTSPTKSENHLMSAVVGISDIIAM
jgi:hypothetical protein